MQMPRQPQPGSGCVLLSCGFDAGPGLVEVHPGPVKRLSRMRAKLAEYAPPHPRGVWPLAANMLDPVRTSVVCDGPGQILQVGGEGRQWGGGERGRDDE